MQSITPFLWFDGQAEEAARFYVDTFPDSEILAVNRTGTSVMSVSFVIDGLRLEAFNGGPGNPFTDAVSLFVTAETQEEIDRLWSRFIDGGGTESQCGWLKDRWGLSWQIVPPVLLGLLSDADPERSGRAMQAMLGMTKLDIAALQAAADGAAEPVG